MRNHRKGFTLIELMMVVVLSSLILLPAWTIFQASSRSSLQGMQQIELVLEARKILRQTQNDLKNACYPVPNGDYFFQFTDILYEKIPSQFSQEGTTYSFLSFPVHMEIDKAVSASEKGVAPRTASKITYRLEKGKKGKTPFLTLIREEIPPALPGESAQPKTAVLSERVNLFSIKEVKLQPKAGKHQFFYQIKLQLGEMRNPEKIQAGQVIPNKTAGLIIGDFFGVVYPEFFSALWNQEGMNRNWHTVIQGP